MLPSVAFILDEGFQSAECGLILSLGLSKGGAA